ncbi:MAG: hypothetical protein VSS75_028720 [Candidatus Parabeggiatoa sp.]|nr:hypothetical protein [Candidatus Parabeggiatoa sp.]
MTSLYYDTFWLENVKTHYVQLKIETVDIYSEKSRVVFQKTMPIPLFLFFVILFVPVLFMVMLWTLFRFFFSVERTTEPSAEEAKEWFKKGQGYFANLPEDEKRRMIGYD